MEFRAQQTDNEKDKVTIRASQSERTPKGLGHMHKDEKGTSRCSILILSVYMECPVLLAHRIYCK